MYRKQEGKKGCKKACRACGVGLTTKNRYHGYALCRECGLANRRKTHLVKRDPKANWDRYFFQTRGDPEGIRGLCGPPGDLWGWTRLPIPTSEAAIANDAEKGSGGLLHNHSPDC